MRCLIFMLLGILAVYSAPVAENDETAAFMAEFDSEDQLAPMEDEELTLSKRLVPDQTIEDFLFEQMENVYKILGPREPQKVKDAIRHFVTTRKFEIYPALAKGGDTLLKLLFDIWMEAGP